MMFLLSSSNSLQAALTSAVYFMVVLSTCSTEECGVHLTENTKNRSVVFKNVNLKLCKTECIEDSFIFAFCRRSSEKSKETEKISKSSVHRRNHPKVPTKFCGFEVCKKNRQCLDNGCGKKCHKAPPLCDLHNASKTGDLSRVKFLLSQRPADINCQEGIGRSPVMWAATEGHKEVVEFLVSSGANLTLVDRFGINILHSACLGGDTELVKYILSQNMLDINGRPQCYRTPVLMAAENGRKDMVELLVSKGAYLKKHDEYNNNIFHCACRGGDVEVVKYILSMDLYKIDTTQRRMSGVMIAAEWGHKEVVELLVQLGASLLKKEYCGNSILHLPCYRGHLHVIEYLLSQNAVDINIKGCKFRTPVMAAAATGYKDIVELLVQRGAILSFKEKSGNNILHLAAISGNLDLVKYIVSLNAVDINSRGWKNMTAVMNAGARGFKAIVELLITNGADPLLKDVSGRNLRSHARGSREIVKYLESLGTLKHQGEK